MIDIKTFFEQSEGKWFTQRTRYNLAQKKVENGKAELTVELLNQEDSAIADLYQQGANQLKPYVSPAEGLSDIGGAKISWNDQEDGKNGSNLLLLIPEDHELQTGQFIQKRLNSEQPLQIGQFVLGEDEALTLTTTIDTNTLMKERLWFAHPNLRLRTVWQESSNGNQGWVIFYSEIRRVTS